MSRRQQDSQRPAKRLPRRKAATRRRWDKKRVIDAIRERQRQRLSLSGISRRDGGLYQAGVKYFGTWDDAMLAAGLQPTYRRWTKQRIVDELRNRHERGLSMRNISIEDGALYQAAARLFGSWPKALDSAGLPFKRRTHSRTWTHERVLQGIRDRVQRGLPIKRTWCENPQLYYAAKKRFGGWHKALLAAGIESRPRRTWTKQKVVDEIRLRHKNGDCLPTKCSNPLYCAATRRFGNWQNALEAAGLPVKRHRKWSPDRVIDALQYWYRVPNVKLREVDSGVIHAAFRHFGSLSNALEAAGLESTRRKWTKRRVIQAIQDGYVRGMPVEFAGFKNITLAAAAKRRFGDWATAVHAAGIAWQPPPPKRQWNQERVIQSLRVWVEEGKSLAKVWRDDRQLHFAARNHFGSWNSALLAAGLKPTHVRRRKQPC